MPKRNNPFGDHSSLQLKTHIGIKEVDKGVEEQSRMQSVYEKTKKLLFDGMRKEEGSVAINNNNNNNFWNSQEDKSVVKPDNLKQMHLNKFCQLVKEEDCEMEVDDGIREQLDAMQFSNNCSQAFYSPKHSDNVCQSFPFPNKHVDLRFSLTEPRKTDFVSASSLAFNSVTRPSPFRGGNAFEQLKQAQTQTSQSPSTGGACHSCRQPIHKIEVLKCQFCENYACGKCTRQCCGCFLHFCPLCSILNYDQAAERAFCFGCNGK